MHKLKSLTKHFPLYLEWREVTPVIMERKILCWIFLFGYLHASSGQSNYSSAIFMSLIVCTLHFNITILQYCITVDWRH